MTQKETVKWSVHFEITEKCHRDLVQQLHHKSGQFHWENEWNVNKKKKMCGSSHINEKNKMCGSSHSIIVRMA